MSAGSRHHEPAIVIVVADGDKPSKEELMKIMDAAVAEYRARHAGSIHSPLVVGA